MIKFTGTILGSNGVAAYTNGVINLNISMPNKWVGSFVQAEVGEEAENKSTYEVQEPIETEEGQIMQPTIKESIVKSWNRFDVVDSFTTTDIIDPSFEDLQETMLASLKAKYPEVEFSII